MENRLFLLVVQLFLIASLSLSFYSHRKAMGLVQAQRVLMEKELDALELQQKTIAVQGATIEILRQRCAPVSKPADPLANGF